MEQLTDEAILAIKSREIALLKKSSNPDDVKRAEWEETQMIQLMDLFAKYEKKMIQLRYEIDWASKPEEEKNRIVKEILK